MHELHTLAQGLAFGEGPRWHDGRLVFSDMHTRRVLALSPDGTLDTVLELDDQPSGLGWDPQGRLLVVAMVSRQLRRVEPDGTVTLVADLHDLASFHCNDMVVSADGGAYIGNFGFDLDGGAEPCFTNLVHVAPDGTAREVASDLGFPNGMVILPGDDVLVVGESWRGRLTAFDIESDGSLSNQRVWAQLPGAVPDGICLDADGAIWSACPMSNRVLRVAEGGEVLDEIPTGRPAYACMLGGADGRTLHICTADTSHPAKTVELMTGAIETVSVAVPGAGRP